MGSPEDFIRLHEQRCVLPSTDTGQRFIRRTARFIGGDQQKMDVDSFRCDAELFLSLYRLGNNTCLKFLESRYAAAERFGLSDQFARTCTLGGLALKDMCFKTIEIDIEVSWE